MEPLTRGAYPESMKTRIGDRLPEFTQEERSMLKGSFDFIGFNYYGGIYAFNKPISSSFSYATDSEIDITGYASISTINLFSWRSVQSYYRSLCLHAGRRDGKPIGEQGRNYSRIYIYPKGLREVLRHIKHKYSNPLIYITENGTTQHS